MPSYFLRSLCGALVVLIFASTHCVAQSSWTGNDIFRQCNSADLSDQYGLLNYTMGVVQTMSLFAKSKLSRNIACFPVGSSLEQDKDILCAWVATHADRRHLFGAMLATEAFANAFPCRK